MPTYCIGCRSKKVQEVVEGNKVYYQCPDCNKHSGRALIVDGKIKIINTNRGIKHVDVAAIILRDNKILLTERRTYPFGLEIPVGHLEYNESLEQALKREVYEEVGLQVQSMTLLSQMEQPISYCRYGSDVEEWVVYLAECNTDEFISNNEIESIVWIDLDKIPTRRLTPHTTFALQTLGYINKPSSKAAARVR